MCDRCNRVLISKAGLKKHMERCQEVQVAPKEIEVCQNGPDCCYLREDRCRYRHDQTREKPWIIIQNRRQGRKSHVNQHQARSHQQSKQQKKPINPQHHNKNQHGPKQHGRHGQTKDVCRNGPSCIFLKHNKSNFFHKQSEQRRPMTSNQNKRCFKERYFLKHSKTVQVWKQM